jgi:hypothetical protein
MSLEPETTYCPLRANATDLTASVCPLNGAEAALPVAISQIQIVISSEPEAICFPVGEKSIDVPQAVCSVNGPD